MGGFSHLPDSAAERVPMHDATLRGAGALSQRHPHVRYAPSPPCRGGLARTGGLAMSRGLCAGGVGAAGPGAAGGLGELQGCHGLAAGPGALPATFLQLPGQRERVWAQGKCTATTAPSHCLPPQTHVPGPARPQGAPSHAPASFGHPQARPPPGNSAASPTLSPRPECSLLGACPCTASPSMLYPPKGPCTASPGVLSPPESACTVAGAALMQLRSQEPQYGTGTGR